MSKLERRWATLTPGECVKELRELQGLSQGELAKLAKMNQRSVSRIEIGENQLSLKYAKALAKALKVHPSVIAFPEVTTP